MDTRIIILQCVLALLGAVFISLGGVLTMISPTESFAYYDGFSFGILGILFWISIVAVGELRNK